MSNYNHLEIEPKWQTHWEENNLYKAEEDTSKEKLYVLDMFPYPSGSGLHVGHPEGYTATDIFCRKKRMEGYSVLHPMGWDAFGLPAENYAIKTGTQPRITTEKNIETFRRQIKSLGFSYDWSREVDTTDPNYYKWTQWIFLKIWNSFYDPIDKKAKPISELKIPKSLNEEEKRKYIDDHRLAYEAEAPINWCDSCKTGIANEEVVAGKCERCGETVVRKNIRQWIMRITEYADRLLDELDLLNWPNGILEMQKNWIGKSEGAEVIFRLNQSEKHFTVFTTRPDTLFGATYCVLSPEHSLIKELEDKIENLDEVKKYQELSAKKSDLERTELNKEKTGVEIKGIKAINPVNEKEIPIYIADYVLSSYGTGAIMAVPAHDERDHEFAKKFGIEIIDVVSPEEDTEEECFTGDGIAINSGEFDGLETPEFKKRITKWLEEKNLGKKTVNYKLRDWNFSRQRYWGEPIPLVHCEKCGTVQISETELPLTLPEVDRYEPTGTGESPLATIDEWVNTTCPVCKEKAKRETNTMPQWAGSCWYYLRYIDPKNSENLANQDKLNYWLGNKGVDLYVGGAEHAVLHLLYSRFWHKVLNDLDIVPNKEPFYELRNQGLILGPDGEKMSKSRGNVINPDEVVKNYGADTLRMYEMFMGPFEAVKPWNESGTDGVYRFLQKVWKLQDKISEAEPNENITRKMHQTIRKVSEDIDSFNFNTAISQMMIFTNELQKLNEVPKVCFEKLLLCLSPFAPHITEELWNKTGQEKSIFLEPWPSWDDKLVKESEIELVIQVMGKVRGKIILPADVDETTALKKAREVDNVQKFIGEKKIIKEIYVPKKLVNFVIK